MRSLLTSAWIENASNDVCRVADETAIEVADDSVGVFSEGHRKLFGL